MRRVKQALAQLSKKNFGNIFQKIATLKDIVKAKKIQLKISLSEENRASLNKAEADLKRYLHIEEEFWRQKARMK